MTPQDEANAIRMMRWPKERIEHMESLLSKGDDFCANVRQILKGWGICLLDNIHEPGVLWFEHSGWTRIK
jgi:hypothetical protein